MLSAIDFIRAPINPVSVVQVDFWLPGNLNPGALRCMVSLSHCLRSASGAQDVAMPERVFAGPVVRTANIPVAAVVDLAHQSNRV